MPRLLALWFCIAAPAFAGDFAPGGNSGTLARGFALPTLGRTAVAEPGRSETSLTLDFTNEYVEEGDCTRECVTLDGETARLRLAHRRALGRRWEVAVEVPVLDAG